MTPDLLVVGAGPAGLATALRARQEGFAVEILDAGGPPGDKACGEGLMPDAVDRLRQLGVRLAAERCAAFRGIRYLDGATVAEAEFPAGTGLGVRRTRLQGSLLERAEELALEVRWGERVSGLGDGWVETAAGRRQAGWIVAADGLRSRLRRWAGLEGRPARRRRFGVRRHYAVAPWSPFVEIYWGSALEAYVTPVGAEEVGVALLWSGRKAGFDELLAEVPALARRLSGAAASSRDRGCGPLQQRVRAVYRGRLALVGDASGYLDAITGEGLALAFHQAFALVAALGRGDLAAYARAHRRIGRLPNALTAGLLWAERHPRLRRRLVRTLAEDPQLFRRLLGVHTRTHGLREVGLGGAWRLARGLAGA